MECSSKVLNHGDVLAKLASGSETRNHDETSVALEDFDQDEVEFHHLALEISKHFARSNDKAISEIPNTTKLVAWPNDAKILIAALLKQNRQLCDEKHNLDQQVECLTKTNVPQQHWIAALSQVTS